MGEGGEILNENGEEFTGPVRCYLKKFRMTHNNCTRRK